MEKKRALERRLELRADVARVFALVGDFRQHPRWMTGLVENRFDPPLAGDPAVGIRFVQVIKEGGRVVEYDGEVTAFERQGRVGFRVENGMFAAASDYRLSETAAGSTILEYTCAFQYKNAFARLTGWLFGWLTRRIVNGHLAQLKTLAEAEDAD